MSRWLWRLFLAALVGLWAWFAVWLVTWPASGQSALVPRADGLWLVISNPPPRFLLQYSGDMTNWADCSLWMAGQIPTVEIRLCTNAERQFWRVVPAP